MKQPGRLSWAYGRGEFMALCNHLLVGRIQQLRGRGGFYINHEVSWSQTQKLIQKITFFVLSLIIINPITTERHSCISSDFY